MVASAQGTSKRRMGRATLASLSMHALGLALIPALAWTATSGAPVETVTFERIAHIDIERQPPAPQPRAAAPRRAQAVVLTRASRVEVQRSVPRTSASPLPARIDRLASAPAVAAVARAGTGTTDGRAAPAPTATPPPRQVATTVGQDRGGYLPFGAEEPQPVLDPGVRKALSALGVHVTLTVTVGQDGKTQSVAFDPQPDGQTQARIQSLLADASWDPAVCGGGISCTGHATIKL